MGINIFLFVYYYLLYDQGPQFEYTRELLGVSYGIKSRHFAKTKDDTNWRTLFDDTQSYFSCSKNRGKLSKCSERECNSVSFSLHYLGPELQLLSSTSTAC